MKQNINEIKQSAAAYIARLAPGILDAADNARFSVDINIKNIEDIFEGINWLSEAMAHIYADPPDMGHITGLMERIMDSLETQDYILTADILEYELYKIIHAWAEGLK